MYLKIKKEGIKSGSLRILQLLVIIGARNVVRVFRVQPFRRKVGGNRIGEVVRPLTGHDAVHNDAAGCATVPAHFG